MEVFVKTVYVLDTFDREIEWLTVRAKYGTVKNRRCCRNSFADFLQGRDIPFRKLTETLVERYEEWLHRKGVGRNASSAYMRTLHTLYNKAVSMGMAKQTEPFKRVYTGVEKTAKRAVDEQVVARLKMLDLADCPWLAQARDYFLFCYCMRGMSFVDMAYLTKANIVNGMLQYRRRKTQHPMSVRIEPYVQQLINSYRDSSYGDFLFPIIRSDDEVKAYRHYQTGLRYYNKMLKRLSERLGDGIRLTSYTARHSWATTAHRHHIPVGIISEGMGHQSERITQIYLDSLKEDEIDRVNAKLIASLDKINKSKKMKRRKKIDDR